MTSSPIVHLIPVSLGDVAWSTWLPQDAQLLASRLNVYIAENAKTARAFLKQIGTQHIIQDISIHTLSAKTTDEEITQWLKSLKKGEEIGLVSEAGCPAVADPGARVVAKAHQLGFQVKPWVGPSSILLALMASGLDGQRFTFHGYPPTNPSERLQTLKQWEQHSRKAHQTQIMIETPYRNDALFAALLSSLAPSTRLCIACSLTTEQEWIRTYRVEEWKKRTPPDLQKKPTLFLFLA